MYSPARDLGEVNNNIGFLYIGLKIDRQMKHCVYYLLCYSFKLKSKLQNIIYAFLYQLVAESYNKL